MVFAHNIHHKQHPSIPRMQQGAAWRFLLLLAVSLSLCQQCNSSPWGPQHSSQHWRKMLQWVGAENSIPYNGSAVLSTYPSLNGTGASLRKLMPAVAGYVNKSGPAEMLSWSQKPHYAVAREAIFLNWRQQELTNPAPQLYAGQQPTCAAARHPPVPFHHCHVFVNHHYRVAYIRSPKSASTSIMNWLGQCRYNKTRNWNSTTCMNYSWEQYNTPQQIASIWKDYFFFGFVRNPWSRAYSLYKDMTATNHFLHKHGPRCQLEWGRFCKEPFAEFDRLYGSGCSHKPPHYAYWHMMDQYHCMITPTGDWAVDFLGRVEKGNEDWRVVVDEMNKRRLPGVPEVQWSDLDHVHKVEPGQRPPGVPLNEEHGPKQQQQQQQERPAHLRHILGEEQEQQVPEKPHAEQQQQQQSQFGRMFRHLWRRIRLVTASANEEEAEADGEVDDFAAAGAGFPPNPDKEGASGPYTGSNEHCIDAVSQWFACDIDKFGYLPPLEVATEDANAAAAVGGQVAGASVAANSSGVAVPMAGLPQLQQEQPQGQQQPQQQQQQRVVQEQT